MDLYDLEMISPWGCNFWMGGLAYDRNYWWSKVIRDVGKYVNGCDMCQKMKNQIEILVGKPKLSEVLKKL